ncbi:MAG: hypothetical protein ABNH26_15075 [Celeribacter sp.]|jgi:hypothetical protein
MTTCTTDTPRVRDLAAGTVDPAKLIGALVFALMLSVSALIGAQSNEQAAPQRAASQGEVWRGNSASLPGDR